MHGAGGQAQVGCQQGGARDAEARGAGEDTAHLHDEVRLRICTLCQTSITSLVLAPLQELNHLCNAPNLAEPYV